MATATATSAGIIARWPGEARESASAVVKQYGEPHEATDSELTWHRVGPWKRIVAQRAFWQHASPALHTDSVETFVDYKVPADKVTQLARFDGSVMVQRSTGEVSARCHDEQTNSLALNLMHDIVMGRKTVDQAREYYAQEFLGARRKKPTPYLDNLKFASMGPAADADQPILSEAQVGEAEEEGKRQPA